jgi:cobalamin biosynthesis protein CobW
MEQTLMPAKIPATVVTGFLGAGKTTLIRHLLTQSHGRRIALIVNEFGDLGVDGEILRGCGIETCRDEDIVELSNGCICCTVADDFIPTMEKLLNRADPPDHIVIETSGLALPQPLVRAFSWPGLSTRVTVDGVVTVVDGRAVADGRFAHDEAAVDARRAADDSLDHETPLSELFNDQIACADLIVVNKADLLAMDEAEDLTARLKSEARPGVQVIRSAHGALPVHVLLGRGQGAEADMDARGEVHHHHHHDDDDDDDDDHDDDHLDHGHDEFESFVVTRGAVADPRAFAAHLARVIRDHDILRLKGFAAVSGKPLRLTVQAVGPRVDHYFDRPLTATEAGTTRLVVIGQKGLNRASIEAALAA